MYASKPTFLRHVPSVNLFFLFIQALLQEIAYAVHLGLPAIMVNLTKQPCTNLAALINGICFDSHVQQVLSFFLLKCTPGWLVTLDPLKFFVMGWLDS